MSCRTVPVRIVGNAPYLPPVVSQEQAFAIKALFAGQANEAEQGMAMRFIACVLCEVDGITFRDDERHHCFAEGKRFVGHQILRIGQMTPEQISKLPRLAGSTGEDGEMPVL